MKVHLGRKHPSGKAVLAKCGVFKDDRKVTTNRRKVTCRRCLGIGERPGRKPGPRQLPARLLDLYRTMRVEELEVLRAALELDADEEATQATRNFCARRIRAIDIVLKEKKK